MADPNGENFTHEPSKADVRRDLRLRLAGMSDAQRHAKSVAAAALVTATPEFKSAGVVMLYLSTPTEVDTTSIACRAWQEGKTVVVPKVSWDQKRMLPVEITSLSNETMTMTGPGIREPIGGKPIPLNLIDLVLVPGLGFSENGYRIGRGMGFYDRFLAQGDFLGVSCGLAFSEQLVPVLPVLDHDAPLSMLVTDAGIRRFATNCIQR
jgi:5-formyltetrahydrofolate cyclo-ligase